MAKSSRFNHIFLLSSRFSCSFDPSSSAISARYKRTRVASRQNHTTGRSTHFTLSVSYWTSCPYISWLIHELRSTIFESSDIFPASSIYSLPHDLFSLNIKHRWCDSLMHKSTKIPTDEASNTHVHPWIFYTYTYTHTHIDIYLFYDLLPCQVISHIKKTDDASLMHHNAYSIHWWRIQFMCALRNYAYAYTYTANLPLISLFSFLRWCRMCMRDFWTMRVWGWLIHSHTKNTHTHTHHASLTHNAYNTPMDEAVSNTSDILLYIYTYNTTIYPSMTCLTCLSPSPQKNWDHFLMRNIYLSWLVCQAIIHHPSTSSFMV